MTPYHLILERFKDDFTYGIDSISNTDIIEYMVLEAAGLLHPLQKIALRCVYMPGKTSNHHYTDGFPRSIIELSIKDLPVFSMFETVTDQDVRDEFIQTVRMIQTKFMGSSENWGHQYHNTENTLYSVILLDESINAAIKKSSLYIAAGDISQINLYGLLMLEKKISLYKNADLEINSIVDELDAKIKTEISFFHQNIITQISTQVTKDFQIQLSIDKQAQQFDRVFRSLGHTINRLNQNARGDINTQGNNDYTKVSLVAKTLYSSLADARNDFFNNSPSVESSKVFETRCKKAIDLAKTEFSKFRGDLDWYNDLHPILQCLLNYCKALLGILSAITVLPAIYASKNYEQGFFGTFFQTKTNSLFRLESFEEKVFGEEGIVDEIHHTLEMR